MSKRGGIRTETLMHMDGCHFYVWVFKDPDGATVITYAERQDENLRLHGRYGEEGDGNCNRCRALRDHKARPRSVTKHIGPLPEDPKEAFLTVAGVVSEIDERHDLS